MARLKTVCGISNENINALPVKDLGPAIGYYESILGFTAMGRDESSAILTRDEVRIGLVLQADHDPSRAGSLAFEVDDLDALHRELQASRGRPGEFGLDQWGGKKYRTFFVREDENGYCYCFFQPAGE